MQFKEVTYCLKISILRAMRFRVKTKNTTSNSHFSYQLMCKGDFTTIISSQFMSKKVY